MKYADHFVQFLETDARLVDSVSRFTREGLDAGWTCMVVATPEHRERIAARLTAAGIDVAKLSAQYQYIALDARTTLATFTQQGRIDSERFHRGMGLLMRQVAARGQPIRIFGEMVALLAADGHAATALQLEELWNELSRHYNFTLFCAYPHTAFAGDLRTETLIRAVHSHVLPADA